MAMSCLAAGFSTGVTSFNTLVSAPWMADSSSDVGLHSDMVTGYEGGGEVFAGVTVDNK